MSQEKNRNARNTLDCIVESETFSSTVLLATSTLNNGINIKDIDVKNVVIDFFMSLNFYKC